MQYLDFLQKRPLFQAKPFSRKYDLDFHIASVHEGMKPHSCGQCDFTCAKPDKLEIHIASVHEGKKPHSCESCTESFAEKRNLRDHIATQHSSEKPFSCEICEGKNFKLKKYLKKHMKNVHSEQF